jgi:hypothetical protein
VLRRGRALLHQLTAGKGKKPVRWAGSIDATRRSLLSAPYALFFGMDLSPVGSMDQTQVVQYQNMMINQVASATPAVSITNIRPYSAYINGSSAFDVAQNGTIYSNLLYLIGTAAPNASVSISNNGTQIGTATADESGNWTFLTGDPNASSSLIASDGSQSFVAGGSTAYAITISPNVTSFTQTPDAIFYTNTIATYNQSAGKSWSIEYVTANHDTRFELRSGDHWPSDYSEKCERSELDIHYFPDDVVANVSFEFMVEAGPPVSSSGWGMLIWQLEQNPSAGGGLETLTLVMKNTTDMLFFELSSPTPGGIGTPSGGWDDEFTWARGPQRQSGDKYVDIITRGHWYAFTARFRHNNSGSGFCTVWIDGAKVLDYTGNLGVSSSTQTYMVFGPYRNRDTPTSVCHFRNILIKWPGT